MFESFNSSQIERMITALSDRLSKDGFQHSLYTAETAAQLAGLYGVEPELAFVAGLLHDWDKEVDSHEILKKAERYCIKVDDFTRKRPSLLHEKTGSVSVHEYFLYEISEPFDIGDRVIEAISTHTLACQDMTDLSMVVYIADMIEPTRDFEGVEDLREVVGSVSLESLFMQAFAKTITSLVNRRMTVHPSSIESWNAYISRGDFGNDV